MRIAHNSTFKTQNSTLCTVQSKSVKSAESVFKKRIRIIQIILMLRLELVVQ